MTFSYVDQLLPRWCKAQGIFRTFLPEQHQPSRTLVHCDLVVLDRDSHVSVISVRM